MFTPTDVSTVMFCVLCAKVARIQHLCFADKRHLQGPGQQWCCSLHWICCQDMLVAFWVYVLKGAFTTTLSEFTTSVCFKTPVVAEMQH